MSNETRRRQPVATVHADASDGVLVEACRGGDAEAWGVLVDRYERLIYAVAAYEGLDSSDASDITQLTFEALLDQLDSLVQTDRLRWWLMSVARRQTWRLRERNRLQAVLVQPESYAVEPSVSDGSELRADRQLLERALQQLGEPCEELLRHLYFDPSEPSYAEVAARLGRSENGIGPTRSRCLVRLRQILESISVDG